MAKTVSQSQVEANLRKQVERLRARVIELQKELKPHAKGPRTYGSAMRKLQAVEHKLAQVEASNKTIGRAYQHECELNRQQRHRNETLFEELQEATHRADGNRDRLIMANAEIDRLREAVESISQLASVVGDASRDGRPPGADEPHPRRLRSVNEKAMQAGEVGGEVEHTMFLCGPDDVREEGF